MGLLHGFAFSETLVDLGLSEGALVRTLLGFNVGVELGQLAVVALFLPLAYALRGSVAYRRGVLVGGSALIVLLASVWFLERAFVLRILAL
ncbi:HupE/UreJ family protein [Simulacricoccus sp. 17bor-14]|nr:HupE/UreJ family protein [Simulacricoccus sp. 17bor-14]